jgi:recombinational DNA repair protein (RecF pathway)
MPEAAPAAAESKTINCVHCNKPVKKLTRYYRDGKFYCAKKCWRAMLAKAKEGQEEQK